MGIYAIKPKFQKTLKPVENAFVKWKVHPTTINILALILSIGGGIVLYYGLECPLWMIYIPILAYVRTALNALDGLVARRLKVKNQKYGEVLNETFDRISDAAIFMGLALASYTDLVLGSVVVVLILLNSYLSIVSKAAGGARRYGGVMGKADRMIWLGVMGAIILIWQDYRWGNFLLYCIGVGMVITFLQRFLATRAELYR